MDNDTIVTDDIAKLFDLADDRYALMVNKTIEPFEWASVMLFNCEHSANIKMTPESLNDPQSSGNPLSFDWLGSNKDQLIGSFPSEWNHTVGYDAPRSDAKIVHYTMGTPSHPEIGDCEYSEQWRTVFGQTMNQFNWVGMMGTSVHAVNLPDGRILPKLHPAAQKFLRRKQKR